MTDLKIVILSIVFGLSSVFASEGKDIEMGEKLIADCGFAPRCVSSQATDLDRFIAPLAFTGNLTDYQAQVQQVLSKFPRVQIIQVSGPYIHAEFTSKIMRYTDDVEFFFVEAEQKIQVRSASRIGYYDFEANRKRVEKIRQLLAL